MQRSEGTTQDWFLEFVAYINLQEIGSHKWSTTVYLICMFTFITACIWRIGKVMFSRCLSVYWGAGVSQFLVPDLFLVGGGYPSLWSQVSFRGYPWMAPRGTSARIGVLPGQDRVPPTRIEVLPPPPHATRTDVWHGVVCLLRSHRGAFLLPVLLLEFARIRTFIDKRHHTKYSSTMKHEMAVKFFHCHTKLVIDFSLFQI